jgi:hypothetical protein
VPATPVVEPCAPLVDTILPSLAAAPTFVSSVGRCAFSKQNTRCATPTVSCHFFTFLHSNIMKLNQKNLLPLCIALFFAALASLTSCRKDPAEIVELLTSSEAAEIIETAMVSKTGGFTMPAIEASQIIEAYLNSCNTPGDTSLQKSKAGGVATYNYNLNMDWLVTCTGPNLPQSAAVNIAATGNFTSLHWAGSDVTAGNLTYTGLDLQAPEYTINGSYELEGDITGTLRKVSPTFNCVTEMHLVDLKINKTTFKITNGTGTATVIANTANGETKTLNASLVFNGDGTLTVTVNGHSHTFPLN